MCCRLTSLLGWNTPAFIISISAVPPATGRTVGSSGSSSAIASFSDVGSTMSKAITGRFPRPSFSFSCRRHVQYMIGDFRARTDPDVRRRGRRLDDPLVKMRAAMVSENMRVAGNVDDAKLIVAGARDPDHFVERLQ